jgi:hypothetical protein
MISDAADMGNGNKESMQCIVPSLWDGQDRYCQIRVDFKPTGQIFILLRFICPHMRRGQISF